MTQTDEIGAVLVLGQASGPRMTLFRRFALGSGVSAPMSNGDR
jgi:hypothetical protein